MTAPFTREEMEERIAEALFDSFDMDWTARDGAHALMRDLGLWELVEAAERLRNALPLTDGLETGREYEEYAYATGQLFQAMTLAPEAFEALRSLTDLDAALATIRGETLPVAASPSRDTPSEPDAGSSAKEDSQ